MITRCGTDWGISLKGSEHTSEIIINSKTLDISHVFTIFLVLCYEPHYTVYMCPISLGRQSIMFPQSNRWERWKDPKRTFFPLSPRASVIQLGSQTGRMISKWNQVNTLRSNLLTCHQCAIGEEERYKITSKGKLKDSQCLSKQGLDGFYWNQGGAPWRCSQVATCLIRITGASVSEQVPHSHHKGEHPAPNSFWNSTSANSAQTESPRAFHSVSSSFINALARANKSGFKLCIT